MQQRLPAGDLEPSHPIHNGKEGLQRLGEFLDGHMRPVVILGHQHAAKRAAEVAAHGGREIYIV